MNKDNTSDDDKQLWALATRDITPIKREKSNETNVKQKKSNNSLSHTNITTQNTQRSKKQESSYTTSPNGKKKNATNHTENLKNEIKDPTNRSKQPYGKEIDFRTSQKLSRGQIPIDATLDLHGMNQTEAYSTLIRFIKNAHNKGQRHILIITGKGKNSEGILRMNVPLWLKDPAVDLLILETRIARREHGGKGALSLLIRRNRNL